MRAWLEELGWHVFAAVVGFALLWVMSGVANAQVHITDADTLRMDGKVWRLRGIDAPELAQTCNDGWPAGRLALTALQTITAGKTVICQERDRDRYGRIVAVCFANGEDIGALMVRRGWAWAYRAYSTAYVGLEELARAEGLGVHAHGCVPAWEWRAGQR